MLNITNKTKRTELVAEIERLRTEASLARETRANLETALEQAETREQNADHKVEVLETDVQNLLGAIRIMADSSREVRIRSRSIKSANLSNALPYRNTETL